jgi:glycosyltransferase involved in cell wall biosynthesis
MYVSAMTNSEVPKPKTISIVIPVYQGNLTLRTLVSQISQVRDAMKSQLSNQFLIDEVILVDDFSQDGSSKLIHELSIQHDWITPIWLSRNYGQHAATLAGMSSSRCEWVVTMDEDGQHAPDDILKLLQVADNTKAELVYAEFGDISSHRTWRNKFSQLAKLIAMRILLPEQMKRFSSFRLIDGELARTVSAYAGNGVYLDVALTWVVDNIETCKISSRPELRQRSGYSFRTLLSHFWRLVLSSGTRPLRAVTFLGVGSSALAIIGGLVVVYRRVANEIPVAGWTSMTVIVLFFSGLTLLALGVLAEYLGIVVRTVIGKPLYVIRSSPRIDLRKEVQK